MQTSRLTASSTPTEVCVGGCIGLVLVIAVAAAVLIFGPLAIVLAVPCGLVSAAALCGLVADHGRGLRASDGSEVVR